MSAIIAAMLGFALALVLAVPCCIAAYQNGVIDGHFNDWLPKVQRIIRGYRS